MLYNLCMVIATIVIHIMEAMFFLGLAGSTIVVLISFVEDAKELFGDDDGSHGTIEEEAHARHA